MIEKTSTSDSQRDTLVCSVPCSIYGSGDDMVCVRQSDGAAIPLKQSEAQLLSRISSVKTVGEWLKTLCRDAVQDRLKDGKHPILGRILQWTSSSTEDADKGGATKQYSHLPLYKQYSKEIASLIERGLVAPVEKSLQVILAAKKPFAGNCRITTLCIPTCGRTAYLSRCVSTFSDSLRAHGRDDATILVVDDSADRVSEARNREVATSLQAPDGPPIQFVGYEERQSLINELLRKKVAPTEVIQFALNAEKLLTTEGSVRNTMMLLTGGQYILQTDDDTFCAYASANASEESVTVSDAGEKDYQTYFYPDRESNLKDFPTSPDIDPFSIHESVLGMPLSNVLDRAKHITWNRTNPHRFAISQELGSRVDVTTTGASGDPGMNSCLGFLMYSHEDTLKRIYSSPECYRWATETRELLRIAPKLTISETPGLLAMSFGINNTRLQPPFFSLGRGLDGAFAHLYRLSDSRSLIGHLPFAISHLSESNRPYLGSSSDETYRFSLSNLIQLCLYSIAICKDASLSQNLRSIGAQFIALGSMPCRTFRLFLREMSINSRFKSLEKLEGIISEGHFKNKEWLREMGLISSRFRHSILDDHDIVIADLASVVGTEESLLKAQSYISVYGQLMLHWEDISDVASQMCPLLEFRQSFLGLAKTALFSRS
jgi:hypothetical protein